MTINTIILPLILLVLVTIVLWILIWAKGYWFIKVPIIIVSVFIAMGFWASYPALMGWPTTVQLPKRFEVIAVNVDEPKAIYVTIKSVPKKEQKIKIILGPVIDKTQPRIYRVPYSRQTHEQANDMQKDLNAGRRVLGTRHDEPFGNPRKKSLRPGDGKEKGPDDDRYDAPYFYKLPTPLPRPKKENSYEFRPTKRQPYFGPVQKGYQTQNR